MEKWWQYFDQLLNCENPKDTFEWTPVEPNDREYLPSTSNEIKQQIKTLKKTKKIGENRSQGEILKSLDEETVLRIHSVIERIWQKEDSWRGVILY